jgi:hypothetical protein
VDYAAGTRVRLCVSVTASRAGATAMMGAARNTMAMAIMAPGKVTAQSAAIHVHLQREEREQQTIRDEESTRHTFHSLAAKDGRREEGRDAHEAVAQNIDSIKERIERREKEHLDAGQLAARQARRDECELHVVRHADQHRVHGAEGNRGMTPDLLVGRRRRMNAHQQHKKCGAEEEGGREQHNDA